MRAFVVTAPRTAAVEEVEPPQAKPGQAVIRVDRAGVCGTDVELFSGEMEYLRRGHAGYPIRPGHEWGGTVAEVGSDTGDGWVGQRVIGDTMLGDGTCERCRRGRQHLCEQRYEVGIRKGWPGALAEYLPMPVDHLHPLPDSVDVVAGAMVEPGANALRAVHASNVGHGDRLLIIGPGTIGLLAALFARADGVEVHLMGRSRRSLDFAESLGFEHAWTVESLPKQRYDAVIDASHATEMPRFAVKTVEPGGRVVFIGLAGEPSNVDSRQVALKDVTVVGILSGSPALAETIRIYASGAVDPRPLVGVTVGLADVAEVLAGHRPANASGGPKVHVDPRR